MDEGFAREFAATLAAHGWNSDISPASILERWSDFATECAMGYSESIYEFENDLSVRDLIEIAVSSPELLRSQQMTEFAASVMKTDERFRAACRTDLLVGREDRPWWRRMVPRLASGEFARDLARIYQIQPTVDGQ